MANTMTEAQKEFGKAKPPNWVSVELKAVKMAAHEASTGDGMIGRGSLKEKTGVCYPRHLRLLCSEGETDSWPTIPWPKKGKNVVFTLEDSCTFRVLVDLWKQAGKIDADIRKTYMIWFNDFLTDKGELPSGKTLEDAANYVREQHWKSQEEQRVAKLWKKAQAATAAAAAPATAVAMQLNPNDAASMVCVQAVAATASEVPVPVPAPAPSRSPLRDSLGTLGGLALGCFASAASSAASAVGITYATTSLEEDEEDEEEQEDVTAGLNVRPMPVDYNGGKLYKVWKDLGPCGSKYPCYQSAGAHDGQKPPSRADQRRKRSLELQTELGKSGEPSTSLSLNGPTGEAKNLTFNATYQNEVAAKVAASHNYAFDLELQRLETLLKYCPPEEREARQNAIFEFAKSQSISGVPKAV